MNIKNNIDSLQLNNTTFSGIIPVNNRGLLQPNAFYFTDPSNNKNTIKSLYVDLWKTSKKVEKKAPKFI